MQMGRAYRVNEPSVAAEHLDDEIVVVSFANGRYYSLRGTGAEVWRLLETGHTPESIVALYSEPSNDIRDDLEAFVRRLIEQELMIESHVPARSQEAEAIDVGAFERPVLEEFDEMKEMLLYDPIHDVDETGWPHLPEPSIRPNE